MDTTKLEGLLKQVSEEMISLFKEGYEVKVSLPFNKDDGCSLAVYEYTHIMKSRGGTYGIINPPNQD